MQEQLTLTNDLVNKLQKEFINTICNNLKIDADLYTVKAIKEFIHFIPHDEYTLFLVEIFKTNSNYKKPMQVLAEVSEKFKAKLKAKVCDDVEEKAVSLVIRVSKTFSDLQKIANNNNTTPGELIQNNLLTFSKVLNKSKEPYFTNKECQVLTEVETFERWFHYFQNADIYILENRLILAMRENRTKFYLGTKEDLALEDKTIIKKLEIKGN